MKTALFFRAAVPVALAAAALLSGAASAQMASPPSDTGTGATVTREDVVRDLAAWKQAGLENDWSSENTPDVNSPEYLASYKKYVDTVKPAAAPPVRTQ